MTHRFLNVDANPTRLPPVYGYHSHPLLSLREALGPVASQIAHLDRYIRIAKTECNSSSEHGLTNDESASIYIYTMDWGEQNLYQVLNALLRMEDRKVLRPWFGYLKLFDTALQKLPDQRMNLWRGINVDITKNYRGKVELTWWNFTSCSSSLPVVRQFLGAKSTLLMVEAKTGKSISAYSNFPKEKEVLLGMGTRVCVMDDPLEHSALNVIQLVEIHDDSDEQLASSLVSLNLHPYDSRNATREYRLAYSSFHAMPHLHH